MMNRRHLLSTVAAFGLSLGAAQAQTVWNLPAAYANTNFHTENLVEFAKDVERLTSGKLKITVHGNASLFKAPEIKRAVVTGQAQVGEVLLSIHENENPLFGIDVVPFLAVSYADSKRLWEASKTEIGKALDAQGLQVLFAVPWPPQGIYAKKDLNTIADMRGLKWRSYNVGTTRIAQIVGAQSVTIQAAELPQALATGVVDSFMSSGATGYDSKVWETLTHFYDTQAWIPNNVTFVNKAAFASLDKPTQEAVLKAAADAEARGRRISEEKTNWFLNELKSKGMKVQAPSPQFKSELLKVGEQLTADWLQKGGDAGKAVIEAFKKSGGS
jgi:TRAP-type C4-dicarboxylate transport system substrate-binding protein